MPRKRGTPTRYLIRRAHNENHGACGIRRFQSGRALRALHDALARFGGQWPSRGAGCLPAESNMRMTPSSKIVIFTEAFGPQFRGYKLFNASGQGCPRSCKQLRRAVDCQRRPDQISFISPGVFSKAANFSRKSEASAWTVCFGKSPSTVICIQCMSST
jgi:hypothetical protein